jgi:hypothetical protein
MILSHGDLTKAVGAHAAIRRRQRTLSLQKESRRLDDIDVPERDLDKHYARAYGIFKGKAGKVLLPHFSLERARWVPDESR